MRLTLPLALAATLLLGNSCATIVSKSRYPVAISSQPPGATFTVTDIDGKEVFNGVTPMAVPLKPGAGYFKKQEYTIKFSMPGYETKTTTISADFNGWYIGNLLFGGFIGLLIVDPLTGAMYRITDKEVQGVLVTGGQGMAPSMENSLQIVSIEDVPLPLREKMEPLPSKQ
ncbi:peptidase associated/transthyretin-like domain-containing protein [Hymenobacter metallicola]|uniref:PEGA domain-containing protein n=1 Tax=Hymenobacter metallicola TaxID=2563114 RepID=A0A4Z0QCP1_9BACT|nr:hypothetical protein [Hymenobacter metallicola]TGE27246.1 hypothetical protein E5K02_12695 [Hymenobacter metallicola]